MNPTPEETVRQITWQLLVNDFGFRPADMEIEFSISMGSSRKRLDIAIFAPRSAHTQENIIAIVECKRADRTNDRRATDQLKSYMSACLNAHHGLVASSAFSAYQKHVSNGRFEFRRIPEFIAADGEMKALPKSPQVYERQLLGQKQPSTKEVSVPLYTKYNEPESGQMRKLLTTNGFIVLGVAVLVFLALAASGGSQNTQPTPTRASAAATATSRPVGGVASQPTTTPISASETPISTNTAQPTATHTSTPSHTPTTTHTPTSTPTHTPVAASPIDGNINIRSGPATSFSVVQTTSGIESLNITGLDGEWYRVELPNGDTGYIASWLVDVPEDAVIPTSVATLQPTRTPTRLIPTRRPTSTVAPAPASAQSQTYYASASANLRSCPRVADECQIVTQVGAGTALRVTGQTQGDLVSGSRIWMEVNYQGQLIYVHRSLVTQQQPQVQPPAPSGQTTAPTSAPQVGGPSWPGCVDINRASFDELQRIHQIGPERAQQIINLRPFRSVDDLTRVSGIGSVRIEEIKAQGVACAP